MKNLVIAVSPDSSLELLSKYADIIVLDKQDIKSNNTFYDTVYIRSHFSQPSLLPQVFRSEIDNIVNQAKDINPAVKFIDSMDTVDAIVASEDKWQQYKIFSDFMPRTELYDSTFDISGFQHPIYKNRFSSRGSGVTWDKQKASDSVSDWIIQESMDIQEELRVYVILGEVYPIGAVKQSMTEGVKAQGINYRKLTQDEITFSFNILQQAPEIEVAGIDIARTTNGKLNLFEVNRSPGFAKFYELTGFNIADFLYKKL